MSDPRTRVTPSRTTAAPDAGGDLPAPGVVGIGLAAVLTFALAQGSWQWFATFIGVTLLAVLAAFQRRAQWSPDIRSAYLRGLVAYALVVGLCVAVALAPLLQRSAWLFPMPGTRSRCALLGRYEAVQAEAALGNLAGSDPVALAYAQQTHARQAVAECLAATTTLWLPLYGIGAAALLGTLAWFHDRARARSGSGAGAAGRV
ncbi:hypothetical protein [Streptomyces sp. NPDC059072]|uniref:hypothetical protein n=1 Tax=Streptomyces sp. NPDC059072 TaxID=3346715 RepID=UPI00367889DA